MAFADFDEFYPFYLGEHANRSSRRLHVIGTVSAILLVVAAVLLRRPSLLPLALLVGYGFAWVGHFFFEKNRPATFKHPLWSLRGDLRMALDVLTGRIAW